MKIRRLYRIEILKPANRNETNNYFLLLKPEYFGNELRYFSIHKSLDDVILEISKEEKKDSVHLEFPRDYGVLSMGNKRFGYIPLHTDDARKYHYKITIYKKLSNL